PSDSDSVCAVGAVSNAGVIASFSSYGYPGKIKPNIVSVGLGTVIAGSNNQPVTGNGTSYSNPNVAGLIACLWQAFPTFTNMQILDAVYKSSDRYTMPTDRYGYGLPNFKTAYRLLKRQLNLTTYGPNWLVVAPNPFTSQITGTFVAQVNGNARIELLNASGQILFTKPFLTEIEEVYPFTFDALDALPGGTYQVKYSDSLSSRTVTIEKTLLAGQQWIRVSPGTLFSNNISVTFTAPETGTVAFRLLSVNGSKLAEKQLTVSQGQTQQISFSTTSFAKGVYYLQYVSKTQQQVVRLLKL
ncbi:MAG: S8 family serine peptidase, partial [Chitinophagaceae bacterium]|nr:S8 family serine peptidase [Chitinophagaceae bacterium]